MSETKKYFWLKLKRDFFKRHDITVIEAMQNGDKYLLFYMKLLVESIDHDGALRFSDTVPYNDSMLAAITHTDIDIVRSGVKVFQQFGMMDMMDDGTLFMKQTETMIGDETKWAEKKRLYREKTLRIETTEGQKGTLSDKSIELDIELEKDISIEKNPKREKKPFIPPTLEDVKAYCYEKGYTINEKVFFDHYDSLDWKDKLGTPVQNWKNKVVNWASKDYNQVQRQSKPVTKKGCPSCGGEIFNSTCRKCGIMLDAKGEILS